MEPANSTKKSAARAAEIERAIAAFKPLPPELDFPIDPSFDPEPPHLDPEAMFRRSEELLRQGARQNDARRRALEMIDVEFIM